jgi:N-formylglutamate amidohydrolase
VEAYHIHSATAGEIPIIVSVPHCGILFPPEIKEHYKTDIVDAPDDTDWFVDRLYSFAPSLGITMITATYSRWVIDLNRDHDSKPLYHDGRIITALCPSTTFLGESLYKDERKEVSTEEVNRRLENYYIPYHQQLENLLNNTRNKFGKVLLWDCHSIRQFVPTIRNEKFPDLILGDVDETSASKEIIDIAMKHLGGGAYTIQHNTPFKGGTITRSFGKPEKQQHALQLEMTKVNYMDNTEKKYDAPRANKMQELLKRTLSALGEHLLK